MQNPQVPPTSELAFRFPLRTRWSDEDAMGVLNNACYLTLLEEGRLLWCQQLGLLDAAAGFGFVLAATQIRFLAPGRGGSAAELHMRTTHLGTRSLTQVYRLCGPDGAVWAEAEAVLVIWDAMRRRSAPMPDHFRTAVLAHEPHLAEAD